MAVANGNGAPLCGALEADGVPFAEGVRLGKALAVGAGVWVDVGLYGVEVGLALGVARAGRADQATTASTAKASLTARKAFLGFTKRPSFEASAP